MGDVHAEKTAVGAKKLVQTWPKPWKNPDSTILKARGK